MAVLSHYDRLGVTPRAGGEEIARAYRTLCRRHHPDLNGGREDALRTMQALNQAYAVLRDPARRRAYDRGFAGYVASAPIRRRRPRRCAPPRPKRRNLGAWVQAAMLATSIFLTVAPRSASASETVIASRP